MTKIIAGFSKLTKKEKINWLSKTFFANADLAKKTLKKYWNKDEQLQQITR